MKDSHVTSTHLADQQRRTFLKRSAALGMLGPGCGLALQLAAVGDAAAFTANDYKALVCVFLAGGNDQANTLIPNDNTNYNLYSTIRGGGSNQTRGGIAYGLNELTSTALTPAVSQTLTDNQTFALNPALTAMTGLFNNSRKAAILMNVGTLTKPLTVAEYNSGDTALYPRPPKLFSHNDQQSYWQSLGVEGASVGWGGRMGDLALNSNGGSLLTCISPAGNTVFLSGNTATRYQITTNGAIKINPWLLSSAGKTVLNTLITQSSSHILENEYAKLTQRSITLEQQITSALAPVTLTTTFPSGNSLADQLKIVARLIGARTTLGTKRQVFFVTLAGFDLHDNLMTSHPVLLGKVDAALNAFYQATVELGVANQVTAFTASEFGRTLTSNGDGSDHGWGGHQFIVGGAVNGGKFYGTAPHVSTSSDDQVGQGRLLPSTSVEQMAATLALWFGASNTELTSIFPHLGNFSTADLGFMA